MILVVDKGSSLIPFSYTERMWNTMLDRFDIKERIIFTEFDKAVDWVKRSNHEEIEKVQTLFVHEGESSWSDQNIVFHGKIYKNEVSGLIELFRTIGGFDTRVVMMSGASESPTDYSIKEAKADLYLPHPFVADDIKWILEKGKVTHDEVSLRGTSIENLDGERISGVFKKSREFRD